MKKGNFTFFILKDLKKANRINKKTMETWIK